MSPFGLDFEKSDVSLALVKFISCLALKDYDLSITLHLRRTTSFHSLFYILTSNLHSIDQSVLIHVTGISST